MFFNFLCKYIMDIVICFFGFWSWVLYSILDIYVYF